VQRCGGGGRRGELAPPPDVVGPTAVVGPDRPVLDREGPMCDRIQERAVVRDQQDSARERLERQLQRLPAFEVEVVGRLVEQQEVRAGGDDQREREPPPLAAGELDDGLVLLLPAREEETAEQVLRLWALQAGGLLRAVEDAAGLVQLDLVL